jgi:ABC-2 type transport system permease protein
MAVHRRTYNPYDGPLTTSGARWLVLPRYAFRELFASRLLVAFLALCLVPALVWGALIYLVQNPVARALLHIGTTDLLTIDAGFFYRVVGTQCGLALLLAAWIGPSLVIPDLANGALPLYLSRPFTRVHYVTGKLGALIAVLSAVTWVPALLLFALQAGLEGGGWGLAHLRVAAAIVLATALWVGLLAFMAVSLSAWVRWRIVASGLFFAVFFVGQALAATWNAVLHTRWGLLISPNYLIDLLWRQLFGLPLDRPLPIAAAWAALLGMGLILLWLLDRRLRACEVVR